MRIARVIGTVTLNRKHESLQPGQFLIADAVDDTALDGIDKDIFQRRHRPMPESLIVFDQLGANVGQLIAVSEGREASAPFYPENVPIDAYNAAILDTVQTDNMKEAIKV